MKLTEDTLAKVVIWCVAFAGIVVLIALNKIPSTSLEYVLFWVAGAQGGKVALFPPKPADDEEGTK